MASRSTGNRRQYFGTNYGPASAEELSHIMQYAWEARQPLLIVGAPGIGKTALINKWSVDNGFGDPICLVGSQMEPPDVTGLPHAAQGEVLQKTALGNEYGRELDEAIRDGRISEEEAYERVGIYFTDYLIPVWQKTVFDGRPHVLFFDEFSNTPRMVQAALLKTIGEKRFANGQKIPDSCFIVAAMNPADSAVDYTPIAPAMVNRMCMVAYRPLSQEVVDGISGGWYTEDEQALWSDGERKWRNRVADFLRVHPELVLKENQLINTNYDTSAAAYLNPDSESDSSEREVLTSTWTSPRSWENAIRMLAHSPFSNEITPIQERILAGCVGRQATAELIEFVRRHSDTDPFDLIRHPENQNWDVTDPSIDANEIYELANTIVGKIPECNGQNGSPTVLEALQFFAKVDELGGSPIFAPHFTNGPAREYIEKSRPSDIALRDWKKMIADVLRSYAKAKVIDAS